MATAVVNLNIIRQELMLPPEKETVWGHNSFIYSRQRGSNGITKWFMAHLIASNCGLADPLVDYRDRSERTSITYYARPSPLPTAAT